MHSCWPGDQTLVAFSVSTVKLDVCPRTYHGKRLYSHVVQVEKGLEVYKMMHEKGFVGSVEVYTAAVHAYSQKQDLAGARQVLNDIRARGVKPDDVLACSTSQTTGWQGYAAEVVLIVLWWPL